MAFPIPPNGRDLCHAGLLDWPTERKDIPTVPFADWPRLQESKTSQRNFSSAVHPRAAAAGLCVEDPHNSRRNPSRQPYRSLAQSPLRRAAHSHHASPKIRGRLYKTRPHHLAIRPPPLTVVLLFGLAAMPPLTSALLSRSTTGSSTRVSAAAAAAISRPAADAAPSSSPPPSRPIPRPRPSPASPFASGLAGRLFSGHRAAARSASSATAVFERRFASAGTDSDDLDGQTGSNYCIPLL